MTDDSRRQNVEFKPCRHMERWVDALANGSLIGVARWYTQIHIAGCRQCRATLEALLRLHERLQSFRAISDATLPSTLTLEKRFTLENALDEVEKKRL